jgi:hypothetical protein
MSKLFIITESERNDIRKMYGLLNEQSTTVCTPFNANSKNLVYDYDQIISSYSALTNSTDINVIFKKINEDINTNSTKYKLQTIPDRTACQIAFVKIRPQFTNKKIIITDSKNNLIYLFDENSNFVAKDPLLSGRSKQNKLQKDIADMTFDEKKEYLTNKLKKVPTDQEVMNLASFLNPAVYKTGNSVTDDRYAGIGTNINYLTKVSDNKLVGQAVHGVKRTPKRINALKNASLQIGSNSETPKVSGKYLQNVDSNGLELSSGCLNVNESFINKYSLTIQNSFLFNISEDKENYYVNNFNPLITDPTKCYSPQSLGGVNADNVA